MQVRLTDAEKERKDRNYIQMYVLQKHMLEVEAQKTETTGIDDKVSGKLFAGVGEEA